MSLIFISMSNTNCLIDKSVLAKTLPRYLCVLYLNESLYTVIERVKNFAEAERSLTFGFWLGVGGPINMYIYLIRENIL